MERLDLYGTTPNKAHKAFIKSFWDEFGRDGNKRSHSQFSKEYTLERLKTIGETVVFRKNTSWKNEAQRRYFNAVKVERHKFSKSHKDCFACHTKATVG